MQRLSIIKVGGAIVDNATQLTTLLREFSALDGRKILVHGGGRRATQLASELGITTRMVNGRRVTDKVTLELVTMVYGGLNKNIVARLLPLGVHALGLTGADMGIVRARRRPVVEVDTPQGKELVDFGYVGDVEQVGSERLSWLLREGITPIIAPLTVDTDGGLLNTNADTVARSVAVALSGSFEVHLVYVFEKAGVLLNEDDPQTLIPRITRQTYQTYVSRGVIRGGMRPKVENALGAVDSGVKEVRITSFDHLSGGTIIELGE